MKAKMTIFGHKNTYMKKFLASTSFVLALAVYAIYRNSDNSTVQYVAQSTVAPVTTQPADPQIVAIANPSATQPQATTGTSANVQPQAPKQPVKTKPAPAPVPTPVPAPKPKGLYADGSYIGSVADAYYGNIQVQVAISGGKIADVSFLQYPNDRSTSRYINSQAMPILKSEAIQSQNANVNTVSGASDTSAAFRQSLAVALSQAKS